MARGHASVNRGRASRPTMAGSNLVVPRAGHLAGGAAS
jgi:hypothetical protein